MSQALTTPTGTLASLPENARRLAGASLAPNTHRAYRGALAALDDWLDGRTLDDAALAAYVAHRHDAGDAPTTIGIAVAAVRCAHRLAGMPDPVGPATKQVHAGARRDGRTRGRGQVSGVQWAQADAAAALAANGGGSLAGIRDAAILAVMSDAMLRVSECSALDVDDVRCEPDGTGRLTIRASKTDQEGAGAVQYVGKPTVARVRAWTEKAGIETGALFRSIRRGGHVRPDRITPRAIRNVVKARAADAGIEGRVSGHSLRVGAAQSLAAGGASLVEMQTAGRWTSPTMPARYSRAQAAARGAVARLRYGGVG